MTAYYNEFDPYAAQWLRNLIEKGLIAHGHVDERSIEDVRPSDLAGYKQCHFFAGIGVWSYALRGAGVPDDFEVWTGSCPCQPFSSAGKGNGVDDERHLWPAFHHLIEQCKPRLVFGEQVASKDGLAWLDLVQADLEASCYASGSIDTCAAGFGAPHIRQRLYWVADSKSWRKRYCVEQATRSSREHRTSSCAGRVGVSDNTGSQQGRQGGSPTGQGCSTYPAGSANLCLPTNGLWREADWLFCRDGKWRPVEPSTFPLAHGATSRVGRLRAYGNALCAAQAQGFIEAYMEGLS